MTSEFVHWCGNCQIRIYIRRHYGYDIDWQNCPYVCKYATQMRCSTEQIIERRQGKEKRMTDDIISMELSTAAKIVLDKLSKYPLYVGKYDATQTQDHFMYGIWTVVQAIAFMVSDECYDDLNDTFMSNMIESEERADE